MVLRRWPACCAAAELSEVFPCLDRGIGEFSSSPVNVDRVVKGDGHGFEENRQLVSGGSPCPL